MLHGQYCSLNNLGRTDCQFTKCTVAKVASIPIKLPAEIALRQSFSPICRLLGESGGCFKRSERRAASHTQASYIQQDRFSIRSVTVFSGPDTRFQFNFLETLFDDIQQRNAIKCVLVHDHMIKLIKPDHLFLYSTTYLRIQRFPSWLACWLHPISEFLSQVAGEFQIRICIATIWLVLLISVPD